ncbi:hypothetical protein RIF25_12915 [Thermosynechococcaceae cyanobacterium BACA0444]|uniref:Uncharacterized protein n=1 Tax=Pseudocalidococcus azoricus BACA0444 TaxID=2918990 RepID=A0AAE4JZ47_9CYAN|nr:hypothetical protein [Pseudocalidococcus azoricus]MDS3861704.1 hypothetical protein [Pseudocalidococcus azoricus BACA0444]
MSQYTIDVEQILNLIKKLSSEDKIVVLTALTQEVHSVDPEMSPEVDAESKLWLDSNLADLSSTDWEENNFRLEHPVEYIPNQGLAIRVNE